MTFPLEEMLNWDVPLTLGNYRDKIIWDLAEAKKRNLCVNVELKMDDMGIFKGKIDIGKGQYLSQIIFFSLSSISFGILKSVLLFDLKIFQN